eukprot:1159832-Pelagomonas_calceolata.AAC.7
MVACGLTPLLTAIFRSNRKQKCCDLKGSTQNFQLKNLLDSCGCTQVLNKYVGQSEENIRNLFAEADEEYKAKVGEMPARALSACCLGTQSRAHLCALPHRAAYTEM